MGDICTDKVFKGPTGPYNFHSLGGQLYIATNVVFPGFASNYQFYYLSVLFYFKYVLFIIFYERLKLEFASNAIMIGIG